MAGALAELKQIQIELQRDYPDVYSQAFINRTGFAMNVTTLRDSVVGGTIVRAIWLLFAAVGLVLLIAAANVANLFLVRIDARRREVAVRTALGADRAHLAVHYLTESILLALIAAAGAIAIAWGLLHVVLAIAPQSLPRLDEVSLDWRGIVFCVVRGAGVRGRVRTAADWPDACWTSRCFAKADAGSRARGLATSLDAASFSRRSRWRSCC